MESIGGGAFAAEVRREIVEEKHAEGRVLHLSLDDPCRLDGFGTRHVQETSIAPPGSPTTSTG